MSQAAFLIANISSDTIVWNSNVNGMKDSKNTPSSMGFSMPAEWDLHEATWLAWPHNPTDWPGKLDAICWVYGEIVRKILPGERIRMLVNSAAARRPRSAA